MSASELDSLQLPDKYNGERLSDYVYRTLYNNIMDLTLYPGMLLNDSTLADIFGCSRTPVREAFFHLHDDFLVDIYPQSGIFVTPIDFRIIDEMQFMRLPIEGSILTKLCSSIKNQYIAKLSENLFLQENALKYKDNYRRFFELDKAFHSIFYEAADTPLILNIMRKTLTHIDRLTYFLASRGLPYIERSYKEHKELLNGILTHNALECTEVLQRHMMEYKNLSIPQGYEAFFRNMQKQS